MKEIKRDGFYIQKDLSDWTLEKKEGALPVVKKGSLIGRNYQVYTQTIHHKEFGWKLKKGALALIATLFSGLVLLLSKNVRSLWQQARTGDETRRIKYIIPENSKDPEKKKDSTNATNADHQNDSHSKTSNALTPPTSDLTPSSSVPAIDQPSQKDTTDKTAPQNQESMNDNTASAAHQIDSNTRNDSHSKTSSPLTSPTSDLTPSSSVPAIDQPSQKDTIGETAPQNEESVNDTANAAHQIATNVLETPASIPTITNISELSEGISARERLRFDKAFAQRIQLPRIVLPMRIEVDNPTFPPISSLTPQDSRLHESVEFITKPEKVYDEKGLWTNESARYWNIMDKPLCSWVKLARFQLILDHKFEENEVDLLDQKVNERIELLDQSFDLRARLSCINPSILNEIKFKDLNAPWNESAIKIAVMTPEEIEAITIDDFIKLSPRQKELAIKRRSEVKSPEEFSKPVTDDNFGSLSIAELRCLPNDVLQRFIEQFRVNLVPKAGVWQIEMRPQVDLLPMLTDQQQMNLPISSLNDAQFKSVYENSERLNSLVQPQLSDCIKRLKTLGSWYIAYLTKPQVQSLDCHDEELFDEKLIKKFSSINSGDNPITYLSSKQIINCLDRGLLNVKSAVHLTQTQIKDTDFTQVKLTDAVNADVINAMLGNRKIQSLDNASLNHLLPFISPNNIAALSETQIQGLDFESKTPINKEQFDKLIEANNPVYSSAKGGGIQCLTVPQILKALELGLFDTTTASYVSTAQIEKIDFTTVDLDAPNMKAIVNKMIKKSRVNHLQPDSFRFLLPHIDLETLAYLGSNLIGHTEFNTVNFDKTRFNSLSRTFRERMSAPQVFVALQAAFYNETSAANITNDQIRLIDFNKLNCEAAGGIEIISAMLKGNKILSLQAGCLNHLLPYLKPANIQSLDKTKIEEIDFTSPNATKALIAALSTTTIELNHRTFNGIACMTPQQVIDALNSDLFDEKTVKNISDDQIRAIDFRKFIFDTSNEARLVEQKKILNALITEWKVDKLQPESLIYLLPHLEPKKLARVDSTHLPQLTFDKHQFDKVKFSGFATRNNVAAMSAPQVLEALQNGFFDKDTAVHITPAQINGMSFNKLDCKAAGGTEVISAMLSGKKILSLQEGCLNHLLPYLNPANIQSLDKTKIEEIDFTSPNDLKAVIDALPGAKVNINYRDRNGIAALTAKQVIDALNRGFFTETTARHISDDHKREIDFRGYQFNTEDTTAFTEQKKILNAVINEWDVTKLQPESLKYLLLHLEPKKLARTNATQIAALDFNQVLFGEGRFKAFATKDTVPHMSAPRVLEALQNGFFDKDTAVHITHAQINGIMNFNELDCKAAGGIEVISAMLAGTKILALQENMLNHLLPYLQPANLTSLDHAKIIEIDFERNPLKPVLETLLKIELRINFVYRNGVAALTSKQVLDCLKGYLFDERTVASVSRESFRGIHPDELSSLDQENPELVALRKRHG